MSPMDSPQWMAVAAMSTRLSGLLDPLPHQLPQLGVHGGQHLGQRLHLRHLQATRREGLHHLDADVAGADDQGRCRLPIQRLGESDGVGHRVQQEDPVTGPEPIQSAAGDSRQMSARREPRNRSSLPLSRGAAFPPVEWWLVPDHRRCNLHREGVAELPQLLRRPGVVE